MHTGPQKKQTPKLIWKTALNFAHTYVPLRDKYVPGGEMWVTESGECKRGGRHRASTYLDVSRMLMSGGICYGYKNGAASTIHWLSSDYGFLAREFFILRPNYFAVLRWGTV